MKKFRLLFFIMLLMTAYSFNVRAQYTMLTDFNPNPGGIVDYFPAGALISDGTYLYGTSCGGTGSLNSLHGTGIVFKIKISDNTFTELFDFGTTNTSSPIGSLVSDGTYLYGVTSGGGSMYNNGIIYKVKISDGTYTVLHHFTSANGNPTGTLITDGTNLYGMTYDGGVYDSGTVFKIEISDTTYTDIFDFNDTVGYYPQGSLISDGTYLYGMTNSGGTIGLGVAFKINIINSIYTKVLDFNGTNGAIHMVLLFLTALICME